MKICAKCNENKELYLFSKNRTKRDGLCSYCKACEVSRIAEWQKKNIEKTRAKAVKWYAENTRRAIAASSVYKKQRCLSDPVFKLKISLRKLISASLRRKGFSKKTQTHRILGADYETVRRFLLRGFFEVYGRNPDESDLLDIDHIKPLVTAKTESDVLRLNHYTNLRYLLRSDNQKEKRALLNWPGPIQEASNGQ